MNELSRINIYSLFRWISSLFLSIFIACLLSIALFRELPTPLRTGQFINLQETCTHFLPIVHPDYDAYELREVMMSNIWVFVDGSYVDRENIDVSYRHGMLTHVIDESSGKYLGQFNGPIVVCVENLESGRHNALLYVGDIQRNLHKHKWDFVIENGS